MLDYARSKLSDCTDIEWREADALDLPFADSAFGAVVCAFGLMFVPDKQAAIREVRRVLKEGGIFLFNVWDRIEENPHAAAFAEIAENLFPGDEEMRFRLPYELYDPTLLRRLLSEAHFREVRIERKRIQIGRISARALATGQIRGTPRSLLIERRGVPLDEVVEMVTAALTKIGEADPYHGSAQALVVEARAVA
jgi:SAM-dependent methyltransferase